MLILKKVAITGGLSSGKTSVCKILEKEGAYVVSADAIVHQLLSPKSPIAHQIVDLLGEEIISGSQFDRKQIAEKVFEHRETLKALESILHPAVLEQIERQFEQSKNQQEFTLFVAEIPLLYEIEAQHLFDTTIAVTTSPSTAQKRFQEKTNAPREEFEKRMIHQLPPEQKKAQADYTLSNDGSLADLEKQVKILYKKLTK